MSRKHLSRPLKLAGWRRKNAASRLFVFFTSNGYQNHGTETCFNSDCGFVQTASGTFLNATFSNYSVSGGNQYEGDFVLLKEGPFGDWWFAYNGTWVGYWPRDLFDESGIYNNARRMIFGGEVNYPDESSQHTATDMGGDSTFGSNASRYQHAAYQRDLRRVAFNSETETLSYQAAGASLRTPTRAECYDNFRAVYSAPWNETMFHGGIGYHTSGPTSNWCTTPTEPQP